MANKKIPVLVLVAAVILALSIGILSALDGSVSGVGHEHGTLPLISEKPTVTPLQGKYTDWFNYTLVLEFYENTTIKLEIEKVGGGWEEIATREYNKSPNAQTLLWNVTPFSAAYVGKKPSYRFKWGNILLDFEGETVFPGPTIVPELIYEFIDATVTPPSGYYNTSFTYSVEFKSNKNQSIALEVYNFPSGKWETHEAQRYRDIGNPEVLSWSGISHFASNDSGYVLGKYRFSFMDYGERYESNIFRDPLLLPTQPSLDKIFKNATVVPSVGEYNTLFNYSVEIVNVTAVNITDVKLVVWNPHTLEEPEFKNATSDDSRLKWSIKPFEDDTQCKGFAGYYFRYDGKRWPETVLCYGPAINMTGPPGPSGSGGGGGGGGYYGSWITYKSATVDPNWVSIGLRDEKKTFNYSVTVDNDATLILMIYNPSSNEWAEVGEGKKSKTKSERLHEWTVNLTLDENWYGICKYQFYPKEWKEEASQIYYGPEILLAEEWISGWKKEIGVADKRLKRPTITCTESPNEGRWFEKFTYTARIRHLDGVNMTLALFVYKPGSEDWALVPWKPYRDNALVEEKDYEAGIAIVEWAAEGIFDEDDANKPPYNYYIWYYDGYNEDEVSFTGPKNVRINHEPEIVDVSVKPKNGSVRSVYLYRAEIYDQDIEDIVFITLYVKDPLGAVIPIAMKEIEINNSRGNETWIISPELGVFSWKKLIEYINTTGNASFMSSYRFEYYDEGMIIARKEHKWTDWIPRPEVSLVKVELMHLDVEPKEGTYADEFVYSAQFYSSEENIVTVKLLIYDPSNPKNVQNLSARLTIPADATNVISWEVKPEVFSSDDFGKTASYRILWEDQLGNNGTTNLITGPSIAKAVPIVTNSYLPIIIVLSLVFIPLAYSGIKRLRGDE